MIPDKSQSTAIRAEELFQQHRLQIFKRTDRVFAGLMLFQFVSGIIIAMCVAPRTWSGQASSIHIHVWAAIFLGGAISSFPIFLALTQPGTALTRYTVAISQMLFSGLLIHLTGGRIETHFHVFGSLAFLAFYRDWRVLVPATIIVALDHFLRGVFFPFSVYGVLTASIWRTVEHASWVVFEDIFLVISCLSGVREMRLIAARQVELETTNERIEEKVIERTAEVRASEERFRLLVDGVEDYAIVTVDAAGRVSSWNAGAERIHGYSAEEILGRKCSCFYLPEDIQTGKPEQALELAREQGRFEEEGARVRKDGSQFWANMIVTALRDETGRLRGFSKITRDITDRRRTAQALETAHEKLEVRVQQRTAELAQANRELQSEIVERKTAEAALQSARVEADRANHAKSDFLSRMSHELRTPLNAILGFGQILELDAATPDQQSAISHILKGGHHLLSLINEVLDIARIESGRIEFSLEPVPVAHVLEESVALVQPLAAQGKVEIDLCKATPPAEHHVLADLQRLKQVVLNLLSNAIKYNRPGGRVTVACEVAEENRMRISVSDTGLGIPADRLEKLFIPFERIGAEHSAVEGTGLGLALSKRLVEAMGGKMGVKSQPGHGSTFWVEFPIAQTVTPDSDAAPQKPAFDTQRQIAETEKSAPSRRLLYIEDNLSNVRLIERILARRPSIKLLVAMQGGLGLDLAREHRPDLILLDLNLPDIPGDELLIRLQADPRTSKIPVVIVSADATPSQISRLRTAGAEDYLTKPLDVPSFLRILDRILVEPAGTPSESPAKKRSRTDRDAAGGDNSQTEENISTPSEELVSAK